MTIAVQHQPTARFKASHRIFSNAILARKGILADSDREAIEDLIDPLFQSMLAVPVGSLEDVAIKAEAIVAEYGEANCVPTYMVTTLVADMLALAGPSPVD